MTVRTAELTLSSDGPARRDAVPGGDVLIVLLVCDDPTAGSSRHALTELDEVVIRRAAAKRSARDGRRLEIGHGVLLFDDSSTGAKTPLAPTADQPR